MIDSIWRTGKNYYPQMFLEEFWFVLKEKKISDDIQCSSDEENSGEENLDEQNSEEENQ